MITFNIRASNGNYYRGHRPSNKYSNCWGDREAALTLTILQARRLVEALSWLKGCDIVIAIRSGTIHNDECQREIFCLEGGSWYEFKETWSKNEN